MVAPGKKAADLACLDDWETYARLCRRRRVLGRYGHTAALIPFIIVVLTSPRDFPKYSLWTLAIAAALLWALLVPGYYFVLLIHARAIRCPKCHHFFGPYEECATCGLPRHSHAEGGIIPALD